MIALLRAFSHTHSWCLFFINPNLLALYSGWKTHSWHIAFCFLLQHLCHHWPLHLPALIILLINAMFSVPIYKTPLDVINWRLTCSNIDFDPYFHCLLELILEPPSPWTSISWTSGNNLVKSRSTLALLLTSMLTSLDYTQIWINFQTPRLLPKLLDSLRNFWYVLKY